MFSSVRKLLLLSIFFITGCQWITIKDGRIPQELLSHAQPYLGEYFGRFNDVTGRLTIGLEGNHARVTFLDNKSNDLLGPNCQSKIGDLESIYVEGDKTNPKLKRAHFKFDANKCDNLVHGNSLEIEFKRDGSLKLFIVERYYAEDGIHQYLEGMFSRN